MYESLPIKRGGGGLWESMFVVIAQMIYFFVYWQVIWLLFFDSRSEFALLYNDKAVLENHHICASFRIMRSEESNILNHLSREEYRYATVTNIMSVGESISLSISNVTKPYWHFYDKKLSALKVLEQ